MLKQRAREITEADRKRLAAYHAMQDAKTRKIVPIVPGLSRSEQAGVRRPQDPPPTAKGFEAGFRRGLMRAYDIIENADRASNKPPLKSLMFKLREMLIDGKRTLNLTTRLAAHTIQTRQVMIEGQTGYLTKVATLEGEVIAHQQFSTQDEAFDGHMEACRQWDT